MRHFWLNFHFEMVESRTKISRTKHKSKLRISICKVLIDVLNSENCRWASSFCHHISTLLGLKWELRGKEHLEKDQACIIVANHQSSLDILGKWTISFKQFAEKLMTLNCFRHVRHLARNEQMHSGGKTGGLLRLAFRNSRLAGRTNLHQSHAIGQGSRSASRCHNANQKQKYQTLGISGGDASQYRWSASLQEGSISYGHRW